MIVAACWLLRAQRRNCLFDGTSSAGSGDAWGEADARLRRRREAGCDGRILLEEGSRVSGLVMDAQQTATKACLLGRAQTMMGGRGRGETRGLRLNMASDNSRQGRAAGAGCGEADCNEFPLWRCEGRSQARAAKEGDIGSLFQLVKEISVPRPDAVMSLAACTRSNPAPGGFSLFLLLTTAQAAAGGGRLRTKHRRPTYLHMYMAGCAALVLLPLDSPARHVYYT